MSILRALKVLGHFCLPISLLANSVETDPNLLQYVNPNIGSTHSRWFLYAPGAVPFGMAKLGPSTNGSQGNEHGWEAVGYEDGHTSIEGFSCFREFQIGGVMLQPVTGELFTQPGTLENPDGGFRSRFEKESEQATAGYYSVVLSDSDIKVELTATERVGFQRYTFPESGEARILFDIGNQLGESGRAVDAFVRQVDAKTVEGYVVTEPAYVQKYQPGGTVKMFFIAKLDKEAESVRTFRRGGEISSDVEIQGPGACLALNFKTDANEQITVKLGLSYTSIENAKKNLRAEAATVTFDEAKERALEKWNRALGRILIEGGERDARVKFYTGLYRALLGRGLASDVNGAYPMNNGDIGQIDLDPNGRPIHQHYNTDAIWGAFWNLTQLWALAYPEYLSDWIQSQLLVYEDAGWLGDGIAASRYVSGVGTNFVGLVIASAYNVGIRDFDVALAYEAALKNELEWRERVRGAGKMDLKAFVSRGFVPYLEEIAGPYASTPDGSQFGASHTLEYSFSSFAVGQFAKLLGKEDDHRRLMELSKGWRLLYDEDLDLIRPRDREGRFIENFDPMQAWRGFQEGNAVQYTYYVPHQVEELVELVGAEEFNRRLDDIFSQSQAGIFGGGTELDAFSGVASRYNHGNQPSLHISWLFNFSGKPYLTQKWVRAICEEFYGVSGDHGYGFGQDEDQGQLGGWYVMASVGLFDVKALTEIDPRFQIGSPLYDRVTIRLNPDYYEGDTFVIETINNSQENRYIQEISLNGRDWNQISLPFAEVTRGGKLSIVLGEEPNPDLRRE